MKIPKIILVSVLHDEFRKSDLVFVISDPKYYETTEFSQNLYVFNVSYSIILDS